MAELNYHHLRYFWAVAHDGNLTRTAERLNLSQSAVSVQIRTLEEHLGHALFERRGRQLHLTEAGRIALDHADTIFAAGTELVGTLKERGRTRQAIRIGALATLSRNFHIEFLRPILGRPDVEVVLRSGTTAELLLGLETLNLDVVLMNQPPPRDAATPFVSHRLAEEAVSLVGTPELVAGGADLRDYLSSQPVILPTIETNVRIGFDALTDRLGLRPQIAAEVDDMAMMRLLAREGAGLAVLPPIVVQDELSDGRLVEAGHLPGISETFHAITMKRRFPNPLLTDLLGTVRPEANQT
ncbi:LysR family transcriptional regulator [Pontivivens ytuae]|uniref:LysR family transcriptional regulator n=1 Tax=Pontivivens ytuae TaxID=2789856 RepID=A0A7S9QCV3_9RHOB|nr:LysR family transcriptional regulator [Pontivivens ytuae]QPH54618.1 LysR family transcriptional regulator [Pontivivens ytuae]